MDSGPVGAATAAPPPRHYCALSPGSYVSSRTREETALLLPGSKLEQFSLQEARSTRTLLPSTPQTVSWILAERVLDPRGTCPGSSRNVTFCSRKPLGKCTFSGI